MKNLTIEKLVYKGSGLARFQDKVVFIPFSVTDDELICSIVVDKSNYSIGKIESISKPSPHRIQPDCEVFGICGGCNWLHIEYSFQLDAKTAIIKELYPAVEEKYFSPIVPSPVRNHYRNKVFYPVADSKGNPVFGIFAANSHQVVQHKKCQLVSPLTSDIAHTIIEFFKNVKEQPYSEKNHSGNIRHIGFRISSEQKIIVVIVTRRSKLAFTKSLVRTITAKYESVVGIVQNINSKRSNTILGDQDKLLYGANSFTEYMFQLTLRLHYQSFFQVNQHTADEMFRFVIARMNETDIVLDAYCGTGIIALVIARFVSKVVGIDSNPRAIEDAIYNKTTNHIQNAYFLKGKVEDLLSTTAAKESINTIIFDPPRKGLDSSVTELVKTANIKKIIYISCDPVTQKRDITQFIEANYKIEIIQPFDMFPHTFHIENVIVLKRS